MGAFLSEEETCPLPITLSVDIQPLLTACEERKNPGSGDRALLFGAARPRNFEARILYPNGWQRLRRGAVPGGASDFSWEQRYEPFLLYPPHLPGVLSARFDGSQGIDTLSVCVELLEGPPDRARRAKGASGAKDAEKFIGAALVAKLLQQMLNPLDIWGRILSQSVRPEEGNLGAVMLADLRVCRAIGRQHDCIENSAVDRRLNRIGEERMALQ